MSAAPEQQAVERSAQRAGLEMAWIYRGILLLGLVVIIALGFWLDPHLFPSRLRICGLILAALLVLAIQPLVIAACFLLRRLTSPATPSEAQLGFLAALKTYDREIDASLRGLMWANPFQGRQPAPLPVATPKHLAVLFLHGYFCNRSVWRPAMKKVAAHGYSVEAITLEPAFGAIENYAEPIAAAIARLLSEHGCTRVVLVAHSMGAVAARYFLEHHDAPAVEQLICIGAPHHGTLTAALAHSRNTRQIKRDSFWLESLNASRRFPRERIINIYSMHDDIVFPTGTSHLEGADNRSLSGIGHVSLLYHDQVHGLIIDALLRLNR